MTSDSEAEYKYSSSNYVSVQAAYNPQCPNGELRCLNGHCITISQLCDKVSATKINFIHDLNKFYCFSPVFCLFI